MDLAASCWKGFSQRSHTAGCELILDGLNQGVFGKGLVRVFAHGGHLQDGGMQWPASC